MHMKVYALSRSYLDCLGYLRCFPFYAQTVLWGLECYRTVSIKLNMYSEYINILLSTNGLRVDAAKKSLHN